MKETELAEVVVNWLQDYKWDIYQEVEIDTKGCIADIVAIQNRLNWIIECKTTLSLSLIRQADNWFGTANYVSVAVPYSKIDKDRIFAQRILEQFGIGLLYVGKGEFNVKEELRPKLNRYIYPKFKTYLKEEHKTWAKAGNNRGERYTPFQATCKQILREVEKAPGLTIKELISRIKHHYETPESAKTSLLKWGQEGLIKGVIVKRDKNNLKFYVDAKE